MVTTRRIERKKLKTSMKHYNIRKCTVEIIPLNVENLPFRKALFKMYRIRSLRVQLTRVSSEVASSIPKLKLLPTPNVKSVRSLVPWLPKTSSLKSTRQTIMEREEGGVGIVTDREASTSQICPYKCIYMTCNTNLNRFYDQIFSFQTIYCLQNDNIHCP